MCQAIHRYAKANNKYMKKYDKNIELSHLMYLEANNLYGWAMSQKLHVNNFIWIINLSKFNESFIKNYDENSNTGYFLEVDVEYPTNLFNLHKYLPFLPERETERERNRQTDRQKIQKLVSNKKRQRKICCSHKSLKRSIK